MPSESAANPAPFVAVAKTAASQKARQGSVTHLETTDYVCIQSDTPLSQAIEIMEKGEGGCAIVCAEDQSVVGIFTERDLLTKIVGQAIDYNAPVSNWMSPVVA